MFNFHLFSFTDTNRDYENPADYSPVILPRGTTPSQGGDRNTAAHSVKHRIEVPEQASPNANIKNQQSKRNSVAADSTPHKFENSFDAIMASSNSSSNQQVTSYGSSFVVANQESPRYSSGAQIRKLESQQPGSNPLVQLRNQSSYSHGQQQEGYRDGSGMHSDRLIQPQNRQSYSGPPIDNESIAALAAKEGLDDGHTPPSRPKPTKTSSQVSNLYWASVFFRNRKLT